MLRGASLEQERFVLEQPRAALAQAEGVCGPARDPRLSPTGNRIARHLRFLLEALNRMENWLRFPGLNHLGRTDRVLVAGRFERLARDARLVAELVDLQMPCETTNVVGARA